jgi:hypothetical protein
MIRKLLNWERNSFTTNVFSSLSSFFPYYEICFLHLPNSARFQMCSGFLEPRRRLHHNASSFYLQLIRQSLMS